MKPMMMQSLKLSSYFTLICMSVAGLPSAVLSDKLLMSLFYQSYGPESLSLIKQVSTMNKYLSNTIQIDLVPYGNSNTTIFPNGTIEFSCQYGPKACYGNKLHACAVKHLEPKDAIAFIICTMNQEVPAHAGFSCAKSLNISYVNVDRCVRSQEGDFLLAAHGVRTGQDSVRTHAHAHFHKGYGEWKPKVTFNNYSDEETMETKEGSLFAALRRYLKSKSRHCKKRTDE